MWGYRFTSGKIFLSSQLQYAPTLTEHDPNPPITLEHLFSKIVGKALASTLTTAGALTKRAGKSLAGALTTLTGALTKQARKALTGVLTSAGALTTAITFVKSLTGVLTSASDLTKRVGKSLSGTLVALVGALTKRGVLALAGTLTSLTGALTKQVGKSLVGVLTSSGVLTAALFFSKSLTGAVSFAGTLTNRVGKVLTGTLNSLTGALTKQIGKVLTGTLNSLTGALTKQIGKALAGALDTAGALTKQIGKALAGALDTAGIITFTRVQVPVVPFLVWVFGGGQPLPESVLKAFRSWEAPPYDPRRAIPSAKRFEKKKKPQKRKKVEEPVEWSEITPLPRSLRVRLALQLRPLFSWESKQKEAVPVALEPFRTEVIKTYWATPPSSRERFLQYAEAMLAQAAERVAERELLMTLLREEDEWLLTGLL